MTLSSSNFHKNKAAIENLLKSMPIQRTTLPKVENTMIMHGTRQWIHMNRKREMYPFLDSPKLRPNYNDDIYNNIIIEKSRGDNEADIARVLKHTVDFLDAEDQLVSSIVLPQWLTPHRNEVKSFQELIEAGVPSEMYHSVSKDLT